MSRLAERPMIGLALRMLLSIVCAGVCFAAWLAVTLTWARGRPPAVRAAGWITAPIAAGLGWAVGVWIGEGLTGARATSFLRLLIWPLVGCAIGAAVAYPFGPMLIVFGMFIGGYASVFLRELARRARRGRTV